MADRYTIDWWFNNVFIRIILPIALTGMIAWMTNINIKLHQLELSIVKNQSQDDAQDNTLEDIKNRVISIDNFLRNGNQVSIINK